MRQFNAFAVIGENYGVIADDIAASDGVDADFALRAFADDAFASVPERCFQLQFAHVTENFEQGRGCAAGRVFLEAMVHLDDFEVERRPENLGGLAREPEERIDAGGKIRGNHHGNLRLERDDFIFFFRAVAGGADDNGFFIFRAQFGDAEGGVVETKIYHDIGLANDGREIIALVNGADDFEFGNARGTSEKRLSHATFAAGDDDFCHVGDNEIYFKTPDAFMAALSVARLAALICTSGRRYSSSIKPSIASAALTGTGFVSTNKSLNSGYIF